MKHFLLLCSFLIFSLSNLFSTTYYQVKSGGWDNPSTWSTSNSINGQANKNSGTYPQHADDVVLKDWKNNVTITLTSDAICNSITFNSSTSNNKQCVIDMGAFNLTIKDVWSTDVNANATITQTTGYLIVNGGIGTASPEFQTAQTIKNLRVGSSSFSKSGTKNLTVTDNYDFNCLQSIVPIGINASVAIKHNPYLINPNVDTIIWTNSSGDRDWDNYDNWINYSTNVPLTKCIIFNENLTVILPSPTNSIYNVVPLNGEYPLKKIPQVIKYSDVLYMENIIIEYGASLLIEPLFGKYTTAQVGLEIADRNEWILVAPNIQISEGSVTRNMLSGDYYLSGTPQVYMNEMTVSANQASWSSPFASMDKLIVADKGFAIKIPDQYGKWKVSGRYYYRNDSTVPSTIGSDPVKYTFRGKFLNETKTPTVSTIYGNFVVVCNTFMANINAKKFLEVYSGQIAVWSFNYASLGTAQMGSFTTYNIGNVPSDLYIKPMQAFMYLDAISNRIISLNEDDLCNVTTSSRYKASMLASENPTLEIIASTGAYSSKMSIVYDRGIVDGSFDLSKDIVKLFSGYDNAPDIFSYLGETNLQSQTITDLNQTVDLGLKIGVTDSVKIAVIGANQFEGVSLVDKETGMSYALSGDTTKVDLQMLVGTNSDRLYLKFAAPVPQELTSSIQENTNKDLLKIYTEDNQHVIISNSTDTRATEITIVDMSGHITRINPTSDSYNIIDMSNYTAGVYAVKAVTGTNVKIEKIIIR